MSVSTTRRKPAVGRGVADLLRRSDLSSHSTRLIFSSSREDKKDRSKSFGAMEVDGKGGRGDEENNESEPRKGRGATPRDVINSA
jgi:hypothetical protein